jgi:glycosyltransferase involved in cell wall biosynthesis
MTASLIAFGGYDTRKPRVRLLIDAVRRAGALEDNILIPAWEQVAQTNVPSRFSVLKVLVKIALGYPRALLRLARAKKGAAVLLPYPGIIEILLIAPLARLMRRKVVLDAFLPIYDTIAGDRALVKSKIVTGSIWWFEKIALGLADHIIVDTDQHGEYFAEEFGIAAERFVTVLVGAEANFAALPAPVQPAPALPKPDQPAPDVSDTADLLDPEDPRPIILFYGQLIPLHGLPTILAAARLSADLDARWVIIGKGQLEPMLREELSGGADRNIQWIEWVDYERLPAVIARAHICLGVFGASNKASRVIPNKLFQQAAMGKLVITRASPAVDALAARFPDALRTVPADDPQALADAVGAAITGAVDDAVSGTRKAASSHLKKWSETALRELSPDAGVAELLEKLETSAS